MAQLLLFAAIREAAGCRQTTIEAASITELVDIAGSQFGQEFRRLAPYCKVFIDGEPISGEPTLLTDTEVALLPPVSGGAL